MNTPQNKRISPPILITAAVINCNVAFIRYPRLAVKRLGADHPVPSLQGLFAVRLVLLLVESSEVGLNLGEVFLTQSHSARYGCEMRANYLLLGSHRSAAGYRIDAADVQTAAIRARGRSYAVSCQQHLLVAGVLRLLVDLLQCTAYGTDTRCPYYFCHCLPLMLNHRAAWWVKYVKERCDSATRRPHSTEKRVQSYEKKTETPNLGLPLAQLSCISAYSRA